MSTTRLSRRYRDHLIALRTLAYLLDDLNERAVMLDAIQALAGDLAMGFAPTEEVSVEAPE